MPPPGVHAGRSAAGAYRTDHTGVHAASGTVTVMVVDDSAPFRLAVQYLVDSDPGFHVVAEAGCGEQALDMYRRTTPDVVVMDIRMPGMGGIEATRRILAGHPSAAVILVSSDATIDVPAAALECGAVAFVSKQEMVPATFLPLLRQLQRFV